MVFKLQKVGLFEVLKSDFGLEVFQRWDKCLDTSNTSYVMFRAIGLRLFGSNTKPDGGCSKY